MQASVSPERYENMLSAESAFWGFEMGFLAGLEQTGRLLMRAYKHIRRADDARLGKITYKFFFRRLDQKAAHLSLDKAYAETISSTGPEPAATAKAISAFVEIDKSIRLHGYLQWRTI